jgi:hypothetical protein
MSKHYTRSIQANKGFLLMITLVFGSVFLVIVSSLAGFLLINKKIALEKETRERAVNIAEAGLDYYRWHLAHFPNDIKDGTNAAGPYVHTYVDPEGGTVGTFSLTINGNQECGQTTTIDISSTGTANDNPLYTRTITGRYTRPSVAEYSYIVNTNVWAGADRVITGKYHSNGGVRMDGSNNSTVESSVSTWQCTSSFGCSGTQTKNGVFGAGSNPALWKYPVPQIDFAGITVDLTAMKTYAKNNGGLYFGPVGGESGKRGYHAIFKADGTVDVYKVTNVTQVMGYNDADGWQQEGNIIAAETFLGNYAIPTACSLVFFEDKLWIEGVIKGKVTVASADVSQPNYDADVVLKGNITYAANDGTDGLTVLAENDVTIPLTSPDTMMLYGIFIAQKGRYGRNYYTTSGSNQVPSAYDAYTQRSSLTTVGTIVSNGRTGTQWTCGGTFCGGYQTRIDSYDGRLSSAPPPFTPYTSTDYKFVEWREVN